MSSCSSAERLRVSPSARFRYGPKRPGDGDDLAPLSASMPTVRGRRQQLQRLVERDGLGRHGREQRRALRLLLRALLLLAELHVRAEAAGERDRRRPRLGIGAELDAGPPACLAISSSASAIVSSSGAMSGGSDAVSLTPRAARRARSDRRARSARGRCRRCRSGSCSRARGLISPRCSSETSSRKPRLAVAVIEASAATSRLRPRRRAITSRASSIVAVNP